MPKSSKPRKAYRPTATRGTKLPINIRFGADAELKLQLVPHELLDGFRRGMADEPDWHALAARLNLGHVLADWYFAGDEPRKVMADALEGLREVWERHQRTGKWGASGPEYTAMADGLNLTDDMQKNCTRRQLDEAMVHVFKVAAVRKKQPISSWVPPSSQQTPVA